MRKVLVISALAVAALSALVSCAYGFLFYTSPGRSFLTSVIERELGEALNSEARIEALDGALPGTVIVRELSLTTDGTPWLEVERLDLRWRPFALLQDRVEIYEAALDGATLTALPPEDDDETQEPLSIRLPRDMPNVSIESISISDVTVALDGAARRLTGGGALAIGGGRIDADLSLNSDDGLDALAIRLDLAPEKDRLLLNARLEAAPGGLVAELAGLDALLSVNATSDSPLADADITLAAALGDYGDLAATATANMQNLTGADARLTFTPGPALASREEFAAPVIASIRAEERRDGGAFLIRSLNGAPGEISGDIVWRNRGRFVEELTATLSATPDQGYLAETGGATIAAYLEAPAALTARLVRDNNAYGLEARLESGATRAALTQGRTDLDRALSGRLTLQLPALEDAPAPLSLGLDATGLMDARADERISLRGLTLETGDGSSAGGDAVYSLTDETLAIEGDIAAEPALIAALAPFVAADAALTGAFSLQGALDRLTLNAEIDAPALAMNDGRTPPFTLNAALAGLPRLPTGDIIATATGGAEGRFEAQLRSGADGRIAAPKLDYRGAGFALTGSGALDPSAERLDINLVYEGETGAEPFPGVALAGGFSAEGVLSRDGALNNLALAAPRLAVNDAALGGLRLTAEGPPGATQVDLALAEFTTDGATLVQALSAEAAVNLKSFFAVNLTAFNAIVAENETRLTAPATFRFEDGVAVDGLRIAYGETGAIALDGAVSRSRWRAALALADVNIPEADGIVTLSLDLDTDRNLPASGAFGLRSLLLEGQEANLSGEIVWTGETLILTNEREADELDMRVSLPARLSRTPDLQVSTSGPLDGYARYDGALETLAAYLPPPLQTLEGGFVLDMTLGGDTSAPLLQGRAQIRDGRYTEQQSGFALTGLNLQANASYAEDGSVVAFSGGARGAGQSGEDTITIAGDLKVGEDSLLNLETVMTGAVLSARPVDRVRADGRVTIAGPLDAVRAEGEITIAELDAEIITPENTGLVDIEVVRADAMESAPQAENGAARAPGFDYQIRVVADDRIFVRGRGLESEWAADVTAVNDGADPVITGTMSLRRGWLDFSGRRFDLTRGSITFDRLSANNPLLDIRAEYETGDGVTAIIAVSGRGEAPVISLQSSPELPSEDVMALVLFGKPAQELGPVETLQIAEALASLSGVGPFGGQGVTGRLRQALRLDLFNIDPDLENGGGALTVGKYVTDGVFISATQDAQGRNGSVRVEYEVTDNISVETELAQDGDQTVSANWKRDF